jgi:hypothetical protein
MPTKSFNDPSTGKVTNVEGHKSKVLAREHWTRLHPYSSTIAIMSFIFQAAVLAAVLSQAVSCWNVYEM